MLTSWPRDLWALIIYHYRIKVTFSFKKSGTIVAFRNYFLTHKSTRIFLIVSCWPYDLAEGWKMKRSIDWSTTLKFSIFVALWMKYVKYFVYKFMTLNFWPFMTLTRLDNLNFHLDFLIRFLSIDLRIIDPTKLVIIRKSDSIDLPTS